MQCRKLTLLYYKECGRERLALLALGLTPLSVQQRQTCRMLYLCICVAPGAVLPDPAVGQDPRQQGVCPGLCVCKGSQVGGGTTSHIAVNPSPTSNNHWRQRCWFERPTTFISRIHNSSRDVWSIATTMMHIPPHKSTLPMYCCPTLQAGHLLSQCSHPPCSSSCG